MPSTSPGVRSEPIHLRSFTGTEVGRPPSSLESISSGAQLLKINHVAGNNGTTSEVGPPVLVIPDINEPCGGGGESTNMSSRVLPAIPEPVPEDVLKPIAEIDERREKLMQWERVKLHKRTMVFSVPPFEKAYLLSLEPKLRRSLWVPALAYIAFALVCLLYPSIWVSKWDTSANILFNSCWLIITALSLFVLVTFPFAIPPSRYLELYIQVWTGFTMIAATVFGTPYRVATITGTDYSVAFPGANLGVADISVFLDLLTIMYFSVYTPLRIRRLFPVAVAINIIYAGISIGLGVPSYDANADVVPASTTENWFAVSLTLMVILSSILGLTGKYRLELFQRTNFLHLEVSQRRIDVLERTIVAFDSSNNKATRVTQMQLTHKRLLLMEKLIFRARSTGLSGLNVHNGQLASDLDHALSLVRKSEKSLFVLDFQKEVLMEGMSSHQQQRLASGETPRSGESGSRGGHGGPAASLLYCSALYTPMSSVAQGSRASAAAAAARYGLGGSASSVAVMPGGEYTTVCFVDDYEELLTRVGHDFTLDVEELWTSHQESRRNPECVLALYMAVARACFPDDQANRILNIGSESHDGIRCPVYERFLSELCSRYLLSVPYHNAVHAAQVTHHCAAIINSLGIRSRLSDLDWASLIIACLSHDVGHFGHTNKFLIETRHPLALRYNDRSVMENYHAATMFDMLKESEDWDISRGLSRSELKRFRSQIVALILSTDIEALPKLADQIKDRVASGPPFNVSQFPEDSRLIRGLSISMADCGHVWLTWDLHYKWAVRLCAEFAAEARELAKVNRQVTAPPWSDSSPASNVDPSPRTQISFIERWPIVMIEALESLIGIDETGFSSTACEWSKAVRRAIRDNVSHWKESEASEEEEVVRTTVGVVDTDAAVGRVAAPEAKVESATVKSDGRDNRRVPSCDDDDDDDDDVPMMSYRDMYGSGSAVGRSANRSSADDEPPMLSYSALYNTDGTSFPPATSCRLGSSSSGSEIASSEQPQGNSQQLALQRGQQNSDDDEDPPMMSYSDLYGSAAAGTRNADMDDPDEPPMLSYGDLYSRLGGMQGSRTDPSQPSSGADSA